MENRRYLLGRLKLLAIGLGHWPTHKEKERKKKATAKPGLGLGPPEIIDRGSQATATNPVEQTSLEVLSRRLTRMTDMFFCTTSLLNLGKETHGMDKQAQTEHCQRSDKLQRLQIVLEELLRLDPTVIQRTLTAPPDCRRVVNRDTGKSLSKGQSNGRSEDMRKMIKLMDDERVWTWGPLPGPARRKESRGLNHEGCAFLLSPPDLDWEDLQYVLISLGVTKVLTLPCGRAKADFLSGKTRSSAQRWPRFCWLGGKGLLLSLSSVDNIAGAPGARGSGAKRKNNKGLAKRYKINRVTTPFIAYVVRHALTSDTQFDEICDGFNYPTFYRELKQYLEAPSFASRAKALVGWWNQRIFGDIYFGPEEPEESQEFNTLTALLAEVEGDNEGSGQENSED
ncbi:hypothetical protein AG1IA_05471 [Rhizoctonia solani AG-1 IA]|uniref:Uncharacterized protein n=1 Tax=Thanatephorus cucumeris (strain AG1-IA) TaxID=983506 RepID=L8WUQ7_THACA|nr:hypothetical protein AG1IA_05471 [Rhizoctonia solani AG-1 IA]